MRSVAIVGAGIAGATAARRLHESGWRVVLVDKGRGVGGRMATRRVDADRRFDHGAQYFTARDPRFAAAVEAWVARGVAAPWGEAGWFVGTPAMTAPVRDLIHGLEAIVACTVARLIRDGTAWRLADAEGGSIAGDRSFDALLLTCPAPQTAALLATAGIVLPGLERVRYAPCWALMLAHDGPAPFDGPALRFDEPGASAAWIARDGTKSGRGGDGTLVVHASPAWSRAHLERSPAEAAELLRADVRRQPGFPALDREPIRYAAAHRWRYALVEQAVETPCFWRPGHRLGAGGDWCLGRRVEAAYLSGLALAERVLE